MRLGSIPAAVQEKSPCFSPEAMAGHMQILFLSLVNQITACRILLGINNYLLSSMRLWMTDKDKCHAREP